MIPQKVILMAASSRELHLRTSQRIGYVQCAVHPRMTSSWRRTDLALLYRS